jgi:hypothetical protein
MNGLPQRSVLPSDDALSRLAALVSEFPVSRRGAILQAVVAFEPASTFAQEFAVGPVRAAFAECWEGRFGRVVPVRELRAVLAPPVPIKTVLEFACFNIITDAADIKQALCRLLSFLAAEVPQTAEESQRSLFPCTDCECIEASPTIPNATPVAGDMVSSLEELSAVGRKYPTIYADPPWAYDNVASRAAAQNHYPTMSLAEICDLPVANLAAADAHLHLWTTNGFLRDAFDVRDAWGFTFKSCLIWVKDEIGMGNYWRVSHEFLCGRSHKNSYVLSLLMWRWGCLLRFWCVEFLPGPHNTWSIPIPVHFGGSTMFEEIYKRGPTLERHENGP